MAVNAKTENDDGSEHQNWEGITALNAETENANVSEHRK